MQDVARAVAEDFVRKAPDLYLTSVSKAKRVGKILIDTFRNTRGATWVAPYSTRAREGAPVSMPIEWDELRESLRSDAFGVTNEAERLATRRVDPWQDIGSVRQRLPRTAPRARDAT
jgi:bifunctional non-homologous end joining protein LigD